MEPTVKVHRHRRRRTSSRYRPNENQIEEACNNVSLETKNERSSNTSTHQIFQASDVGVKNETTINLSGENDCCSIGTPNRDLQSEDTANQSNSQSMQETILLINGHIPVQEQVKQFGKGDISMVSEIADEEEVCTVICENVLPVQEESPPQQTPDAATSSRNSSGDAMSLRETLQQLPPTISVHRHRRTHSPQPCGKRGHEVDLSVHRGILGFIDREIKQSSPTPSALSAGGRSNGGTSGSTSRKMQSFSDPQSASPAQRSVRSRSSLDKSPRRKRSKSESRRRRERKLIAAGEMEVRQANETLMRYLKQCSEMNDASLSGELEIDHTFEERRVHRKTKSQRDKRGLLIGKLYTAGGLSSILKELSDDIAPAEGEDIYNPFTPTVQSPTDDTPAQRVDKLFLQTSSGYRPIEQCFYKHSYVGGHRISDSGTVIDTRSARVGGCYNDTGYLLEGECRRPNIRTNIELACVFQRICSQFSNICHGLLAGLALAHLILVISVHPINWSSLFNHMGTSSETTHLTEIEGKSTNSESSLNIFAVLNDYASLTKMYLNAFYCLTIVCLVSIFDRVDVCRWDLSNAPELISFRWLIVAMIYVATIILTLSSDTTVNRIYFKTNSNVTEINNEIITNNYLNMWSSLSMARSIAAICGWIMISLTPHEDLLYEHLLELIKFQMTNK